MLQVVYLMTLCMWTACVMKHACNAHTEHLRRSPVKALVRIGYASVGYVNGKT